MGIESVVGNFSDIISVLPVDTIDKILQLVLVLKALSIAAIFYFAYIVVMGLLTYRRMKKVDEIEKKMVLMDGKLDKILKKKS